MKKKSILLLVCAIAISSFAFVAEAQGIGGLLRKGKETVEKVRGTKSQSQAAAPAVELGNGMAVINPIAEFIEITPVGLYGVSKSDNYGDAYLVVKAELKIPKESAVFGSSIKNQKMMAVDASGHLYNIDSSGAFRYDLVEGVPVVVKLDDPGLMFTDIPKTVTVMPVVKFGINIDAYHQDNLTLKNVPIYWDVTPEF